MALDWNQKAIELQPHYSHFNVTSRILLTGHSHQAWPDVAREAQLEAYDDAACLVDDKWSAVFKKADIVRANFLARLGDTSGDIALAMNTQELLVRWLSALPLDKKPHIVTTDGEFHSMRRLLDRLNETQIEVVKIPTLPVETLVDRLCDATENKTAAVLCSMVLFQTSEIVPNLSVLAARMREKSIPVLFDAYHLVNAVPFSVDQENLWDVFIVGGGYKYCQLGEGNCFLRVPKNCDWRPLVTGWYAEFASIDQAKNSTVGYGKGRWAFEGSTYDPTSHYRAARVLQFFNDQKLDVETLRGINQGQLTCLREELANKDWPEDIQLPTTPLDKLGGFLVIKTPRAATLVAMLREVNVFADSRGDHLRLGPAPYITRAQLVEAINVLYRAVTAC